MKLSTIKLSIFFDGIKLEDQKINNKNQAYL